MQAKQLWLLAENLLVKQASSFQCSIIRVKKSSTASVTFFYLEEEHTQQKKSTLLTDSLSAEACQAGQACQADVFCMIFFPQAACTGRNGLFLFSTLFPRATAQKGSTQQ